MENNTSPEQVSVEEVASNDETSQEAEDANKLKEPVQVQSLTEERILELLAQRDERNRQSARDIVRNEIENLQRKLNLSEAEVSAYRDSFGVLPEENKVQAELNYYRQRDKTSRDLQRQEDAEKAQREYAERLEQSLEEEAKALGIDPKDNRLDYAKDAKDYFEGRRRFSASIGSILQADVSKRERELEGRIIKKLSQTQVQQEIEAGLESHDRAGGAGLSEDESVFMQKMMDSNYITSKDDLARIRKIQQKQR